MSNKLITKEYLEKQLKNYKSQVLVKNFIVHEEGKDLFSGSYNDLTDKPDIPTVTNDLTDELKVSYDNAVVVSHEHTNSNVLNKFTENEEGKVLYKGAEISTDIKVSEADGNAIRKQEDGLFVSDKTEEIQRLSDGLGSIEKYKKYVNTELDSCFCQLASNYTPVVGAYVPFTKVSGSFEVNNGRVIVKPGQRVQIGVVINYSGSNTAANIGYQIKDFTNNIMIHNFRPYRGGFESEYGYTQVCQYTNETDNDCEIGLYIIAVSKTDTLSSSFCSMTVQEINRAITIDPLEHVNAEKGIEDTPVGHIISHMGTVAPKHYLICNGSEYNIEDYPYLAEHITKDFGSVNYFGGDGTTTFAVPDLRGEFLRGTGTATRNTGSGAGVGVHQNPTTFPAQYSYIKGVGGATNTFFSTRMDTGDVASDGNYGIRNSDKSIALKGAIKGLNIASDETNSSMTYASLSSRPTNTAVLYCIKYEPTYYMQNYYNGNEEVVLYEGNTKVACGTTLSSYGGSNISLVDSIDNYDEIKIFYASYTATSDAIILNNISLKQSDIRTRQIWLHIMFTKIRMSVRTEFNSTRDTLSIVESLMFNPEAVNTSNLGINIYRVVGCRTSLIAK